MTWRKLMQKQSMLALFALLLAAPSFAQEKPNILIIWGDDIGPYDTQDAIVA